MAINLVKGQRVEIGLSKLIVEMGWKVNPNAKPPYDLVPPTFLLVQMEKLALKRILYSMVHARLSRLLTVNARYPTMAAY